MGGPVSVVQRVTGGEGVEVRTGKPSLESGVDRTRPRGEGGSPSVRAVKTVVLLGGVSGTLAHFLDR